MNKKKIIIIGATGNLGSYLTKYASEYFNKDKYEIIASGRKDTDVFQQYDNVTYIPVDISKSEDFEKLPKDNVYAVMLLAAKIPSYMDNYDAREYIDSNIIGAYNTFEYCRKVKADRIIYTQTVFDISLHKKEGIPLKPDLPAKFSYTGDHAMYVITKNTALEMLEHYHQEYGIKKFVFRLTTVYNYSPYQYYYPNGKKTMRPIYKMINKAIKGEPIEIWGDPKYSHDMVHVYDFSQMLCKAVEVNKDKGIYNVGTGKPVTLEEEIRTIVEVFSPKDKPSPIIYCPEKKNSGGSLMDVTNAIEDLGYEPKFDCKKLLEDYKKEMEIDRFGKIRRK